MESPHDHSNISHCTIIACNPHAKSLTLFAAHKAKEALHSQKFTIHFHYLDEDNFNPIFSHEDILRRTSFDKQTLDFQSQITHTKVLALFFPDWWGMPPALLVGWLQRVFCAGTAFAYTGEEFMPQEAQALLSDLKVFIAITSDELDENIITQQTDNCMKRIFRISGISKPTYSILADTRNASTSKKNKWFAQNEQILMDLCES